MVDFFRRRQEVKQRQAVIESFLSTPTRGEEQRLELTKREAQEISRKYEAQLCQQVDAMYAETTADGRTNSISKIYWSLRTLLPNTKFTLVTISGTPLTEEGKQLRPYLQKEKRIL